jgi:hypothetical protein
MERIQLGGRRVAGFGLGWSLFGENTGTSPNPAYRATAAITGQHVDPSAPADTPAGPSVQNACANIPTWAQAISGCSNANVALAPGTTAPTAPAPVSTILFGGGVDANGKPIKTPLESAIESANEAAKWFSNNKTAIAIGAVAVTGLIGIVVVKSLLPR